MSRKDIEPKQSILQSDPAEQEIYFLPELGQHLHEGQTVTYEVGIDRAGRQYAFNIRIVDEPSVH